MTTYIVTGIGTEVGKTVAAAVLTQALEGDYWKPVQCGDLNHSDTMTVRSLTTHDGTFHKERYSLRYPLSPHHAARLEDMTLHKNELLSLPYTERPLIIEGAGGPMVPLSHDLLFIDLFQEWNLPVIVVSKHYLGSINHTLTSVEALKSRGIEVAGLIFNGTPNQDTEEIIQHYTQLPLLGRLLPETTLTPGVIQRYAEQWKQSLMIHN